MHVPSFLVGSLFSGTVFLAVNQQLSYRERLSKKWPFAEYVEDQFRAKWKEFTTQLKGERQHLRQQLGANDTISKDTISKKYLQMVDDVQDFFSKKD
mmetsp:Transcript_3158/g.5720  ORF Transcript_3158/g.5720 Transcript_3158/m.5720 type:complete len:97 (-) Transcript_3158:1280-1570(-)